MNSATTAVNYMRATGARTKTRLRELVAHFSSFYNDDFETAFSLALDLAKSTVFDFDAET